MYKKRLTPTVYDVAKMADVSAATVSRYINRSSFVSDAKSQRIEQAMIELDYKPNFTNKATAQRRRTLTIGALVQHPDSPYTSQLTIDMETALMEHGYSMITASGHWSQKLGTHALNYLGQSQVDGVIIITGNIAEQQIVDFAKTIPVVAVGYHIEAENVRSMALDNELGGYIATLHLLQRGHRKIVHIKGLAGQPDSYHRFEGYKRALTEQNIPIKPTLIKQGDFSAKTAYQKIQEMLKDKQEFTAIFAANDLTAYGAIKALHDNGLRVPEDVSVVGFDDLSTSAYFTPALTTLRQPIEELGAISAKSILNMLSGNRDEVRLPPIDLIVRDSTQSL